MNYGFIKVAAATPRVTVADCKANTAAILEQIEAAAEKGVKLLCFPELCITGATCGDLFYQASLLKAAMRSLQEIAEATVGKDMLVLVGLPLQQNGKLYNCAALLLEGNVLGFVPKAQPQGIAQRCFAPASEGTDTAAYGEGECFFASNLLLTCQNFPGLTVGVTFGEALTCARERAGQGATVLLDPTAEPALVGRAEAFRQRAAVCSAAAHCGIVSAGAGEGESSTDHVFAGRRLIAENGSILAESPQFENGLLTADLDLELLCGERQRDAAFSAGNAMAFPFCFQNTDTVFERKVDPMPFIPEDKGERALRCAEIFAMQALGLQKRLEHARCQTPVLGISGGLDSTLALLVTARACDRMGLARKQILAVTMPGFGTTGRTKSNAELLCERLGVSFMTVPITDAVRVHFKDIGQDENNYDVTFENAQARERTQILMDLANQRGGLVVGTGDLSELALGWATYNGDHMAMYGVNAGIPKTLVRHLVKYAADTAEDMGLKTALEGILNTPVSPELLPPENGDISQKTENIVGPYELHDFFLYHLLRFAFSPKKILFLAEKAFEGSYTPEVIRGWLRIFLRRFFAQQFKRSCLPDGPAVGSVGLSPRGGWNMPSDAAAAEWLRELEEND